MKFVGLWFNARFKDYIYRLILICSMTLGSSSICEFFFQSMGWSIFLPVLVHIAQRLMRFISLIALNKFLNTQNIFVRLTISDTVFYSVCSWWDLILPKEEVIHYFKIETIIPDTKNFKTCNVSNFIHFKD